MLNIVIPAYFGNQYENRKNTMFNAVKFLSQSTAPIYILAQEWVSQYFDDFKAHFPDSIVTDTSNCFNTPEQIKVVNYSQKLGLCGCRNEVFSRFLYNTDADFLYTQDNDIRIMDIYSIIDLFKIFHTRPQGIQVDMLRALMPNMQGFREFNITHRPIVENNFTFYSNGPYGGGAYFLRNLKKSYGYELFSKDYIDGNFVFEDILFQSELIKHGGIAKACEQFWVVSTLAKSTVSDIKTFDNNLDGNKFTKYTFLKLHSLISEQDYRNPEVSKTFSKVMRELRPKIQYTLKRNYPHEFTEFELDYKPRKNPKSKIQN